MHGEADVGRLAVRHPWFVRFFHGDRGEIWRDMAGYRGILRDNRYRDDTGRETRYTSFQDEREVVGDPYGGLSVCITVTGSR